MERMQEYEQKNLKENLAVAENMSATNITTRNSMQIASYFIMINYVVCDIELCKHSFFSYCSNILYPYN